MSGRFTRSLIRVAAVVAALAAAGQPRPVQAQFWKKIARGTAQHAAERAAQRATQAESTATQMGSAAVDSALTAGGAAVVRAASSFGARRSELHQLTLLVAAGDTSALRRLQRIQDEMIRADSLAALPPGAASVTPNGRTL